MVVGGAHVARAATPIVTVRQCVTYGAVHRFITGRPAAPARRACLAERQARILELGLPLPFELSLIRACESGKRTRDGRGIPGTFNYRADNDGPSTASGAFQYLDTTWRSGAAGRELQYRRALDAPRSVQDGRAIRNYRAGDPNSPWNESRGCWG